MKKEILFPIYYTKHNYIIRVEKHLGNDTFLYRTLDPNMMYLLHLEFGDFLIQNHSYIGIKNPNKLIDFIELFANKYGLLKSRMNDSLDKYWNIKRAEDL